MSTIYLAASFRHSKLLMRDYAAVLRDLGHIVTSRWIDSTVTSDPLDSDGVCRRAAEECLADIGDAAMLVCFTEHSSVGKNIELGYAIASGKQVVIVGSAASVFHFLPEIVRVSTWAALLEHLEKSA